MEILILNWRDPKNPKSGGAEILNMHILKPFLSNGYRVTWYSQSVQGLPSQENYQGIKILRFGNVFTHYLFWPLLYLIGFMGQPDVVIDCVHGLGYLAKIFSRNKRNIVLVCEVARNIWDDMLPFPVNIIGKISEKYIYWFYQKSEIWTISRSTKSDLVCFGVNPGMVSVLPMGYDSLKPFPAGSKYTQPTAIFLGRLCAMKGISDAVRAIAATKNWRLIVVGRGGEDYEKQLQNLVNTLKVKERVIFKGFVSQQEKFNLLSRAWVLLVPSTREGWGMIVPEANSVGTPVIGYNVPGLREVLPMYSKGNKLIHSDVSSLTQAMLEITRAETIHPTHKPGWSQLENKVSILLNVSGSKK